MENKILLETWGDLACFTRPESKVERLSYPVPTPSAMRGLLSSIYCKPLEFYWQVNRVEVLKPIKYISFKRNEVKDKVNKNPILVEESRTQRQSVLLKDVRYRVYATIVKREEFKGTANQLYEQAMRRISAGKCFSQPYLGLRECVAYFEPSDLKLEPYDESIDLGYMLYDVFDLHKYKLTEKVEPYVTLFHAKLENGVLNIPDFDSNEVIKPRR